MGYNVFTEINLVDDGYVENINLARNNSLVLFLGSPLNVAHDIVWDLVVTSVIVVLGGDFLKKRMANKPAIKVNTDRCGI